MRRSFAQTAGAFILACCLCLNPPGPLSPSTIVYAALPMSISDAAMSWINSAVQAVRNGFFLYLNSDSGYNNGFFSGFFPGGATLNKIHLNTACVYDPISPTRCSSDPNAIDRVRGTVARIGFDALALGEFAGVNVEEPENWGVRRTGVGYDL